MKKFCLSGIILLFALTLRADVSPWDAWRLGYTCFETGESNRDRGEYTKALKSFKEALEHYNNVRRARPDWNQRVIARRIAECERECERMKRFLGDNASAIEKIADSGAADLRPAAREVARELDKIRKELSEAQAELAALRRSNSSQRNYELEITQLLRDQRVALERYKLLERRYRDLDQASRQPSRQTQELKEQLLEEKMQTELLRKQIATLEQRRKSDENRYKMIEGSRKAIEKQLIEKNAEISRLSRQESVFKAAEISAAEKYKMLTIQLEEAKAQLAIAEQAKEAVRQELTVVKQKMAQTLEKSQYADAEVVKKLQAQINADNLEKKTLRSTLDKTIAELESLKIKLIQLQVLEAARQELERHLALQNKNLSAVELYLATEKRKNTQLEQQAAQERAAGNEKIRLAQLRIEQYKKDVERLKAELEKFKTQTNIPVNDQVKSLEKQLASERKKGKDLEETRLQAELLNKKLQTENAALEKRLTEILEMKRGGAATEKELREKLAIAENRVEKTQKLLEANVSAMTEKNKKDAAMIAGLNIEIRKLQGVLKQKESEIARVSSNPLLAEENRKLNEELGQIKHLLQKKDAELTRLTVVLENTRTQNNDFLRIVTQHKSDSENLNKQLIALQADLERERRSASAAAGELQRTREAKTEIEQDLKNALERASALETRLSNRDNVDLRRMTAEQEERKKLSDQLASVQNDNIRLKAELDSLRQSEALQKKQLEQLKAEQTTVTAERNRLLEDNKKNQLSLGKLAVTIRNYERLQKDFAALQAENKENKLLIEAAKPREAELSQIKLRLTELEQLKVQLSREQRLNEELKIANRRLESERGNAIILRSQLNNAQKRIGELEPLIQEIAALKKLNKELASAKDAEAQLVQARAKLNSLESLRVELEQSRRRIQQLELEKLEVERRAARAGNLASGTQLLNAELESIRKTADELAKDKALREMELARMRARLNEIPRLEAEIKRLRSGENAGSPEALAELARLKRDSEKFPLLEKRVADQEKEVAALQRNLRELGKENSTLRLRAAESEVLRQNIARLQRVHQDIIRNLPEKQKNIASLLQRMALLERDASALQELKKNQQKALQDKIALENELRVLRSRLSGWNHLLEENAVLKKQNSELPLLDEARKKLAGIQLELVRLKSRAETAEKLQKQLLAAETAAAEKQAALDRSQRQLAAVRQLKTDLLVQKNENTQLQLELSRIRSENERTKLQLLRTDALRSELEKNKSLIAHLAELKNLESELAQAKLKLAEFEQVKRELERVTRYNNELTLLRQKLENELASRPGTDERSRSQVELVTTLPGGKPEDYIASGKIAEADGSVELAIWNYEQALKLDWRNAIASWKLGRIMSERGNYQRAVDLFTNARAVDPGNMLLACDAARAYIGLKRNGNALAILSPLEKRFGDDYRIQLLMGKALAGSGDFRQAEVRMKIAVRKAPQNVFEPRLELAKLLLASDVRRLDEAARIYEAARIAGAPPDIELEPKLGSRLEERREVLGFLATAAKESEKSGDWKTAIWYYKQLVAMGRNKDEYVVRLAFAQYKGGSPSLALETLTFNRSTAMGNLLAALIHLSGKDYTEMLASARKAIALNSGKQIVIPVDFQEFFVEFERLKKTHSGEMIDAVRRIIKAVK